MLPTKGKSKLPPTLTYPLKPKVISEAFADVPQASSLTIFFFDYSPIKQRIGKNSYPVMTGEYHYMKASQFTPRLFESLKWNEPQWEIMVCPVPRELKPRITPLLQSEAFPKLHQWLVEKNEITGKETTQKMTVLYNEDTDELEYQTFQHP